MTRIDRLQGYLLVLQSRKVTRAQDLAQQFEVSERTVYRDMQALGEVGVPLVGTAGEGYRLMPGYYLPPIMFSADEARALFLSISMLSGLTKPGDTRDAAQQALAKIRAVLPAATLANVEALEAVLGFYTVGRTPLDMDDETFVQLQQAIHERRVVHLHYHAMHSNAISARDVEPLHLSHVGKGWTMSGYCRLRQDQRHFRLTRIDQLRLLDETFEPREVHLAPTPEKGWRIVVRFEESVVRWVREAQHFTLVEDCGEGDDGAATMVYRVASFEQIRGWLMGWGEAMTVIEPEALRAEIAAVARGMVGRHEMTKL